MKKIAYVVPVLVQEDIKTNNSVEVKYNSILNSLYNTEFEVDVITTCVDKVNGSANTYLPGVTEEENYRVIRFPSEKLNEGLYNVAERDLLRNGLSMEEWYKAICRRGVYSPALFDYIHATWRSYDAVLFVELDSWTTLAGIQGIDNAILISNISSDNIRLAATEYYKKAIQQAKGAVCFDAREYDFIKSVLKGNVKLSKTNNISKEVSALVNQMAFKPIAVADDTEYILYSSDIQPAFKENNVSVVLASDNNYIHLLCVAIQSVIDSGNDNHNYDFIILSDGINYRSRRTIYTAFKGYRNVSIRFLEISGMLDKYTFSFRCLQLSRATFSRLLLPELLKDYKKVVYIDCDVIVKKDIHELYSVDIEKCFMAAVEDPFVNVLRNNRKAERDHLLFHVGKKMDEKYFNAGVLVMNLEMFRKHYTTKAMMKVTTERTWMWEDQDVLNKLCKGNVLWMPVNWNYLWGREETVRALMKFDEEYFRAYYNPYIIHYAGGCMPLRSKHDEFEADFWDVARKTPYYESLIDDMVKNSMKSRFSVLQEQGAISVNSEAVVARTIAYPSVQQLSEVQWHRPVLEKGLRGVCKKILRKVAGCLLAPFANTQTRHNEEFHEMLVQLTKLKQEQQMLIDDKKYQLKEMKKIVNRTTERR